MKTYSQKLAEIERSWYLIDVKDQTLGRVATQIAGLLTGKSKPSYTPHMDGGDYVVVINAASVKLSGNKESEKIYYRHSGYPGNLKQASVAEIRAKYPEQLIERAVYGMLAKNKLRSGRLERLKVYPDSEHAHQAQQPQVYKVAQ